MKRLRLTLPCLCASDLRLFALAANNLESRQLMKYLEMGVFDAMKRRFLDEIFFCSRFRSQRIGNVDSHSFSSFQSARRQRTLRNLTRCSKSIDVG